MSLLLASIAALGIGPLVYRLARRRSGLLAALDGFVFVAIGGLILLSVLPEAMAAGGWLTIGFVLVGFAGPTVAEHLFHRAAKGTHVATLILGLVGLSLHALLDGVALGTTAGQAAGGPLAAAVILHRLPVGLAIWWLLRPPFGATASAFALGFVAVSTGVGYAVGPGVSGSVTGPTVACFQAFVGGSLLHVVFFRPHLDDQAHPAAGPLRRRLEGAGAVLAVLFVAAMLASGVAVADAGLGGRVVATFVDLAMESAPALLLAFAAAGAISVFMPASSLSWMGRGGAAGQAMRGMGFGLPLPICSCGVVPLYRTLILKGVPPTAAMAFLVATPELGLDAIFISIPLLGPHLTIVRVISAAAVALAVGWVVGSVVASTTPAQPAQDDATTGTREPLPRRIGEALRVGLGDVVDDTAPWILAGLAVAALAAPFLDGAPLAAIPLGIDVILFALLGVPTYVCASAATPLVAVLLVGGLSPGAALAFLITGPATNITTFGVLTQLHGRRAAATFSAAIIVASLSVGYFVNGVFGDIQRVSLDTVALEGATPLDIAAGLALFLVFGGSLLRRGPRGFVSELSLSGR